MPVCAKSMVANYFVCLTNKRFVIVIVLSYLQLHIEQQLRSYNLTLADRHRCLSVCLSSCVVCLRCCARNYNHTNQHPLLFYFDHNNHGVDAGGIGCYSATHDSIDLVCANYQLSARPVGVRSVADCIPLAYTCILPWRTAHGGSYYCPHTWHTGAFCHFLWKLRHFWRVWRYW